MDKFDDYWNAEWSRRIKKDGSISTNMQKANFLIEKLWGKPYLIHMDKLDIGCGPSTHIRYLASICREWDYKYTGIDTSRIASESAKQGGLNVICESIYTFETDKRFEAFFMFDVLEHMEDHELIAQKIKNLAADKFIVLINIPLYKSNPEEKGGFERLLNISDMHSFLNNCGASRYQYEVYGINGYPYLFLEGANE